MTFIAALPVTRTTRTGKQTVVLTLTDSRSQTLGENPINYEHTLKLHFYQDYLVMAAGSFPSTTIPVQRAAEAQVGRATALGFSQTLMDFTGFHELLENEKAHASFIVVGPDSSYEKPEIYRFTALPGSRRTKELKPREFAFTGSGIGSIPAQYLVNPRLRSLAKGMKYLWWLGEEAAKDKGCNTRFQLGYYCQPSQTGILYAQGIPLRPSESHVNMDIPTEYDYIVKALGLQSLDTDKMHAEYENHGKGMVRLLEDLHTAISISARSLVAADLELVASRKGRERLFRKRRQEQRTLEKLMDGWVGGNASSMVEAVESFYGFKSQEWEHIKELSAAKV